MKINYNRTGAERKSLVAAIADITGAKAKYLGAPSFAYQVDYFTIDRNGIVSCNDMADGEQVDALLEELTQRGFTYESAEYDEPMPDIEMEEPLEDCPPPYGTPEGNEHTESKPAHDGLTIQMPAASFTPEALNNLHSLIAAKGKLIRKALGVDLLPVQVEEDTVSFPWFSGEASGEEVKAYTHLVTALCDMARNQKRIIAREKDTDNEKYAFRCFLLRLGFIGTEYKEERKILLRNLTGNGAFKSGQRSSEAIQPEPPNAAARVEVPGDPALAEALADAALIEQVNASFDAQ